MSYQIQESSDGSSDDDWVSYSGSSTHEGSRYTKSIAGLLSTLKRNWGLTSSSIPRRGRFKLRAFESSNDDHGSGPAAAAAPVKPRPNGLSPSGREPLQTTEFPNNLALSSQLSTSSQTHVSAPHFTKRHVQRRRRPLPLSPVGARDIHHGDIHQTNKVFLLPPLSLTSTPQALSNAHVWSEVTRMDPNNPAQSPNLSDLLTGLSSNEDASRKMAAFKLQSLINDPSFAEQFVLAGGLPRLRTLVLESSGNTLAYSLASFARLLEVDQGWEAVNDRVVEKAR